MTETVLIVDDDPLLREVYRSVTANAGYNVLLAGGGEQARDTFHLNINSIQLVLTDINMPIMKGPELISQLKAIRPDLKAIYMSGFLQNLDAQSKALVAESVLIQKPFTTKIFLDTIRDVLDGRLTSGLR